MKFALSTLRAGQRLLAWVVLTSLVLAGPGMEVCALQVIFAGERCDDSTGDSDTADGAAEICRTANINQRNSQPVRRDRGVSLRQTTAPDCLAHSFSLLLVQPAEQALRNGCGAALRC